jgi:hypothetical protein
MKNSKPLICVASACEKVLQEMDGVFSGIRFVDTFHVSPMAPPDAQIAFSLLVLLKAGDFVGEGEVSLKIMTPDGRTSQFPQKWPVPLGPANAGVNIIVGFAVAAKYLGRTWIDVCWNSEVLTSIPITLQLARQQS